MKLIKTKKHGYFLEKWPTELKGNRVNFFIPGEGYKKDTGKIVEDIELPDTRDESLTWFDIAKIGYTYGINVATEYADCKVAGIIARRTAYGYIKIYTKIKDIIDETTFNKNFFTLLRCDYMMSCFGMYSLDIIELDKKLSELDPEYSGINCTYKGEKCSMNEYIKLKYGEIYSIIIEKLITPESVILN